jgi:hypothetical protein
VHGIARQRRWEEHDCDLKFIKSKVEYINGGIEDVVRRKNLAAQGLNEVCKYARDETSDRV